MTLDTLTKLKDFLADRPEWAFLAIALLSLAFVFRLFLKAKNDHLKEKDAHLATALKIVPLAEKLLAIVDAAKAASRRRRGTDTERIAASTILPPTGTGD